MSRRPSKIKPETPPKGNGIRINRYLANCGLCSRREAERWILAGRVTINGLPVDKLGTVVKKGDRVKVDGRTTQPLTTFTYLAYHKPRGQLCSRRDPKGRPVIYDHLDVSPSVQSVGRLDMDTEGLLLLTDDGHLARVLTHPATALPRTYRARITGHLSPETLTMLCEGGAGIGKGEISDPWEVSIDSETGGHSWLTITIRRGRWREIRRTLAAHGHLVRRLIRIRFGPVHLNHLAPGEYRRLRDSELSQLRQLLRK
jgi:23S rRNA pseudouridine2605 synthase